MRTQAAADVFSPTHRPQSMAQPRKHFILTVGCNTSRSMVYTCTVVLWSYAFKMSLKVSALSFHFWSLSLSQSVNDFSEYLERKVQTAQFVSVSVDYQQQQKVESISPFSFITNA